MERRWRRARVTLTILLAAVGLSGGCFELPLLPGENGDPPGDGIPVFAGLDAEGRDPRSHAWGLRRRGSG